MPFGHLELGLGLSTHGIRNAAPSDIALSAATVAEDADLGHVIGALSATDPEEQAVTFSLVSDAGGLFGVSGSNLIVTGVLDFETEDAHEITVRATDEGGATYDENFTITVTDVAETPPENPPPDDGDIDDDGTFTNPPIVTVVDGGIKLHGKKSALSAGKFIYDLGPALANKKYTIEYDPDFTLLTNTGKNAAVGFVFKQGNDFHFVGLEGNGTTGLNASQISGDGLWNVGTGWTETSGGAAQNGTQAGPNFIQIEIAEDGSTYTFRSGSDIDNWDDEFTAEVPVPHSDATSPAQFGIGAIFRSNDTGSFSIKVSQYIEEEAAPTITEVFAVTPSGGSNGWHGFTLAQHIPATLLAAASGDWIRLTLEFTTLANGAQMTGLYIGENTAGDAFDFDAGTKVQVTFAGIGTITGDGSTLIYVSDWVQLPQMYDEAVPLAVAVQFSAAATVNLATGIALNQTSHYKAAADAATDDKTGYTFNALNSALLVTKIEIATSEP